MKVSEFFSTFRIAVDKSSFTNLRRSLSSVRGMVVGLGAAFAGGALVKHMVRLGVETENVVTQVAGMLALSKGTNLSDEMSAAADSVQRLRVASAGLPGSFREYANFMGRIRQQASKAGLGIREIESLTQGAVVATKALNVHWMTGARDIDQFLQGRWSVRDELTTKLMTAIGMEDRKAVNAMTRQQRAKLLQQAFASKQISQLATAQANTVGGKLEKLKDQFDLFMLRVGGKVFGALGDALGGLNKFLEANKVKLQEVADVIGGYVSGAFAILKGAIAWLIEHGDVAKAILVGVAGALAAVAVSSLLASLPIILLVGKIALLAYLFGKLKDAIGTTGAVFLTLLGAGLVFRFKAITTAIWGMVTASRAAAASASAAGAAVNGMGGMALGAAGRGAPGAPGAKGAGGMPVAAAAFLPFAAAMLVDQMIPRDEAVDATLGDWSAMKGMMLSRSGGETAKLGAGITNNYSPQMHLTINGIADPAQIESAKRAFAEENARAMRHLQVATAGGKR